ncbi:expressed unknown protein [Seminavis robusta]|uniref:Uncharacterized protein n=1 Tax=Seminavis robusta TaxID=568900 RepID=A0A9N8DVT2_9STRA|nr:expressed unknown protein [Seminavis robusta]|eukprot:Sro393_g133610.1 n/a (349) ;mRNA; f:31220-32266
MSSSSSVSSSTVSSRWASIADRLNPKRAAYDEDFKSEWQQMSKSQRQQLLKADKKKRKKLLARGKTSLPFTADPDDHCETSPTAFQHIVPLLQLLEARLKRKKGEIKIYDGYYCAGGTAKHLKALGFHHVYNQPDDFYQVIAEHRVPEHDVLVTNPPYSGDHFDRLLQFLEQQHQQPFLLLLPSHFSQRPAFQSFARRCVYLTPPSRYHYWTPEGRRRDDNNNNDTTTKKRKHKNLHLGSRNSPFYSYWFLSLEPIISQQELLTMYDNGQLELIEGCKLHREPPSVEGSDQVFRPTTEEAETKQRKQKKRKQLATTTKKMDQDDEVNGESSDIVDDDPFLPPELQPVA